MTEEDISIRETMNTCEEYREAIAADPSFDGGAAHLSQCASCQGFREEMQALDVKIGRALALSVPEFDMPELADIDTSSVTALPQRRFGTPIWLAVAATVTLAAGTFAPASAPVSTPESEAMQLGSFSVSLAVKEGIGAERAIHFDLSNACAGMLTGVAVLDSFVRNGTIRCGMVVSGEYITSISDNAARTVRNAARPPFEVSNR